MADTIFQKILSRDVPCHEVYDDALVFAFLDISPLSPGHTLVIPKEPAETLDQLSDESAAAIGRVLPRICRAVKEVSGCADYNILQNNGRGAHQVVLHVHFHVIPKPTADTGLKIGWPASSLHGAAGAELARRLRVAVAK